MIQKAFGHRATAKRAPAGLFFVSSVRGNERSLTNETGASAFGYPAKDQRELAAECRRLMSMLVPDKHRLPELVPARMWLPASLVVS
jgi:hypothetical protein